MDFLFELLVQIVLEFLGDLVLEAGWEGTKGLFGTQRGRAVLSGLVGFGVGCAWGAHLTGGAHYPKLLWVSVALAVLVAVRLLGGVFPPRPRFSVRGYLLAPPWQWHVERVVGFLLLNLGLAGGILTTFRLG